MNIKFVMRGLLLALPVAAIASVAFMMRQGHFSGPLDPTPPPPTILAPRGELPAGPVGLQEWARYRGQAYSLVGSGFLLSLSDGKIVGVTTAHSVSFGNPDHLHLLERIALGVAGQTDFVAEFDTLWGQPGQPRTGGDMTVDYVLLQADQPIDSSFVLRPDPRGAPQPGERVSLFSGLGDGHGGRRILEGTVQAVDDAAVWVLMDGLFDPSLMSGSPFVSQHTGQVVGMAIAVSPRRGRLLLGAHPIGSIVRLAESAAEFPKIEGYRR
ncbi:MAG TPA: serine protease [Anaerolineae bacterium]|nr:serine protease [Anaerolineae bacterium]